MPTSIETVGLFKNFNELASPEFGGYKQGYDFDIAVRDYASPTAIIGIHAGKIEKTTSDIVRCIAGEDLSYYLFEGKMPNYNMNLHLSSHLFDEPQLIKLLNNSDTCVSIHGFKEDKKSIISIGGQNKELAERIFDKVKETGLIEQETMTPEYQTEFYPEAHTNIANKTKQGGVQIEISKKLRQRMQEDRYILAVFSNAVREAICEYGDQTTARLFMDGRHYKLHA